MSRALTAADLWALPRLGGLQGAGPNRLVVGVTTYDIAENRGAGRLWLIEGQDHRPISPEHLNASKPSVAPDGKRVAYLAAPLGEATRQLYVQDLAGEEAVAITDLPLGCLGGKWLPDGSGLIVLAYLFRDYLTVEETAAEKARRDTAKFTVHATEFATYRYWDMWLTTGEVPHLFRVDADGSNVVDLTPKSTRWWSWPNTDDPLDDFDIAPDGKSLAFSADASDPPHRQLRRSIFEIDLATGTETELTPDAPSHATRPRYSPDGAEILYGQQMEAGFYGDRVRLAVFNRRRGLHKILTEAIDLSCDNWEYDGRGDVVFLAEDKARTTLFRLIADRPPDPLAQGGTLASVTVTDEGVVYMLAHSFTSPPEVVRLDSGGRLEPVTNFSGPRLAEIQWADVNDHTISGADSHPVQFYLLSPPGAERATPVGALDPRRTSCGLWRLLAVALAGPGLCRSRLSSGALQLSRLDLVRSKTSPARSGARGETSPTATSKRSPIIFSAQAWSTRRPWQSPVVPTVAT